MMEKKHPHCWSDERIAALRKRYESSTDSLEALAIDFRSCKRTINRMALKYGWKRRAVQRAEKIAAGKKVRHGGWKPLVSAPRKPTTKHHFNGWHGTNAVADDARVKRYGPELLRAIKVLQKNDFAVFKRGDGFMVGTKVLTEEALMQKAARYA